MYMCEFRFRALAPSGDTLSRSICTGPFSAAMAGLASIRFVVWSDGVGAAGSVGRGPFAHVPVLHFSHSKRQGLKIWVDRYGVF